MEFWHTMKKCENNIARKQARKEMEFRAKFLSNHIGNCTPNQESLNHFIRERFSLPVSHSTWLTPLTQQIWQHRCEVTMYLGQAGSSELSHATTNLQFMQNMKVLLVMLHAEPVQVSWGTVNSFDHCIFWGIHLWMSHTTSSESLFSYKCLCCQIGLADP